VPHHMLKVFLVAFLAASIMTASCVAQAAPQSLKTALHLDSYKVLRYQDKDGATISESEFKELVSAGQSFSIAKDEAESIATLSINSAAIPAPSKKVKPGQSNTTLNVPVGEGLPPAMLAGVLKASRGDQLEGRPILLSFFFHDCLPCIQEVGTLNEFREGSKHVSVVAVTFDSKSDAAKFTAKYGFTWPVAASQQEFIDQLGVKAYPTLVLLSANGTVLGARTGNLRSTSDVASPLLALKEWTRALLQTQHN